MIVLLREVRIQQQGCSTTLSGAASESQPATMLVCAPNLMLIQRLERFPNQMEGHG